MRKTLPALALAAMVVLALLHPSPAWSQDRSSDHRQGFFWGVGLGAGSLNMDCGPCAQLPDSIPYSGGAGLQLGFVLGGEISPRVLLALGGTGSGGLAEGREVDLVSGGLVLQVYPSVDGPLLLRLGIGLSASTLGNGRSSMTVVGVGGHAEVRWELWRNGGRAIGPYLGVMQSANEAASAVVSGDEAEFEMVDPPRHPRAIYLGVGVTWY